MVDDRNRRRDAVDALDPVFLGEPCRLVAIRFYLCRLQCGWTRLRQLLPIVIANYNTEGKAKKGGAKIIIFVNETGIFL